MNKFDELRNKYQKFIYSGFSIEENDNELKITYHFEIEGLDNFNPEWTFKKKSKDSIINDTVRNMAFSLGMVELISYWKITCAKTVEVLCGKLTDEMIFWWKELYFGGLGEFFYINSIKTDIDSFMSIVSSGIEYKKSTEVLNNCGMLVPVGGGKDSSVTLEILRDYRKEISPYIINGRGATDKTCDAAGYCSCDCLSPKRTLDKNMIELNKKGYLNGHTPFSAIVAFSSIIQAYLSGKKYIVLSNESSANESTILGEDINHQFSKGVDFEANFRDYVDKYIISGIEYFSFLRPLSEFQIAMLFSTYEKYHKVFRSCNAGSKTDSWCCNCPKCLFVYTILSAFLSQDYLESLFGENLLEKESLTENFFKLAGILPDKPFECVGSRDEFVSSCYMALEKNRERVPYLLKLFSEKKPLQAYGKEYFINYYDEHNFLPTQFQTVLKNALCSGVKNVFKD